ncbi:ATP-binding protein [Kitasatospora sp. NPDC018619]|uniref:ATP-binding protein n=1 Tax=unclassified Kitasatospora TaxID=2633591 RepID=UPI0037B05802
MDRFRRVRLPGPIGGAGPGGGAVPPGGSAPCADVPFAGPRPDETKRFVFSGRAGAVRAGRDFSRDALWSWHWLPAPDEERLAVAEDVLLMVAELVTNACLHTRAGPAELRLRWNGRRLRAEVSDASPVLPQLRRHPDPGRPGRQGLRVVERLAGAWGCVPEDGGKVVWLEVALPPRPPSRRGRTP